jgi:hypothetical protein
MTSSHSTGRRLGSGFLARISTITFLMASITTLAISGPVTAASRGSSMTRSPLSPGTLAAQAVQNGSLKLTPGHGVAARPSSPSATVLPNKQANTGTSPANEVPITADPNNAMHLMSGANDYNCSTLQGFYNSDDGGATWRQHCMPPTGGSGCGDPAVAYDNAGNAYTMGIASCSTYDLRIQKSTDNGVTWGPASVVITSGFSGGATDKEWLEADQSATSPYVNCLYASYTDFNSSFTQTRITVAHSCDGGVTFTKVGVTATTSSPTVDQFSDLAIAKDGTVYVTWMRCVATGPAGDCGGTTSTLKISKSTDGGTTWSTPVDMATAALAPDSCFCAYYGNIPGTSERTSNIPVIDIDDSTGNLHVAFYQYIASHMVAKAIKSVNMGATWSVPVTVLSRPSDDQAMAWLSVNPTGKIGVSFLDNYSGTLYHAVSAFSANGGTSYALPKILSTVASNFVNDGFGGSFIGDYIGNIWTGNTFHASWPDTRSGSHAVDMTGGVSFP